MIDRIAAHGDALECEHGKALDLVVVPGMVTERTLGGGLEAGRVLRVGANESFEHDFGGGGHLQRVRHALDDLGARAAEQSRELIL